MNTIPQFGELPEVYQDRPGAYGIIRNAEGKVLAVYKKRYHLPGGGIDAGEDPETALRREIKEETGYEVGDLALLGQANQFLDTNDLGPINKLGIYFSGKIVNAIVEDTGEADHEVRWIEPEEFLASTAHDFHKWAVKKWSTT